MIFLRCIGTVLASLLLSVLTPVRAHLGVPASQLSGVTFCLEPSSVQLETEGIALSPTVSRRVRREIAGDLQKRLEAQNVPYDAGCAAETYAGRYVLLGIYARFLDPQTYVGFLENSYTYVTVVQVGDFAAGAEAQTVLPGGVYSASTSDIFQAATPGEFEKYLVKLGETESEALILMWLEANTVTLGSYLFFVILGLSLVALRVLSSVLR